jgi:uncharacterized Fe-S cluster-containing radical SAM superfamily protein
MYDPLKRAADAAGIVCRNDRRNYHRFRPARFYGGIATAYSPRRIPPEQV